MMADEPYSLQLLRRNDPSETNVCIRLWYFSDYVISAALQANDHVNGIILFLDDLVNNTSNWELLLHVIATRDNLERVTLCDNSDSDPARATPFLLAIQQNPRIHTVRLVRLQLSDDSLASFLDSATSVTTIDLIFRGMEAPPADSLVIADALQRNTNIQRLELWDPDERHMIPILNSLATNTSVKELELWLFGPSLDVSIAAKNLLESTTTIQQFHLKEFDQGVVDVDTFLPIAQGLIQSTSVTNVKFEDCNFDSQEAVHLLNSILKSKVNLQWLALRNCSVHQLGRESFRTAIFSLLQPHSMLRSLQLGRFDGFNGFKRSQDLNRLLTAVETSPLERFSIGTIDSRENCLALITSIPNMHVLTLELELDDDLQDLKGCLVQAVKQNAILLTLRTFVANAHWLDDDETLVLLSYLARNEFLAQWIEDPNAVPRAAWAEYLAVAETTGPDTVFPILQGLTKVPVSWFEGA